jgi:uncharacterized membrane protein (UPF0136 family)
MNETSDAKAGLPDSTEELPRPNLSIFDFTPEDLQANRHGYISPRQRQTLQRTAGGIVRASRSNSTIALVFVFFGLILIVAMYLQNESTRAALFSSPLNLVLLAGAVLLVMIILGFAVFLTRRQTTALAAAQLQKAEGAVHLEESYAPESAITSYRVYVGNERFAFSEDMSGIFTEGKNYRVYFVHSGPYHLILSLEKLRG